jgi:hypothetical protein
MICGKANGRRMAVVLLKHAAWISPPARKEWTYAMLNELEHIPRGASALSWALGCTFVSYRERAFVMSSSLSNLPRWLLSIEMAVCLVPLTWLFIAVFTMVARGVMPLEYGILVGSAALLGPIGLVVGPRISLLPRGSVSRTTTTVMAFLAAWNVLAYSGEIIHSGAPFSQWWRDFVLIALLPTWAVVHLLQINAARRATVAIA